MMRLSKEVIEALGGTTAIARLVHAPVSTVNSWKDRISESRLAHLMLAAGAAGLVIDWSSVPGSALLLAKAVDIPEAPSRSADDGNEISRAGTGEASEADSHRPFAPSDSICSGTISCRPAPEAPRPAAAPGPCSSFSTPMADEAEKHGVVMAREVKSAVAPPSCGKPGEFTAPSSEAA